ncbi:LOW QUALITY PROTEIN: peroxisomal multifunctional enzyme type 2-like [Palaemon carinicauda]|uniref:LOW QUALITY PROTEIN: peroxisomal multifunctional enzyme type 2-like n=1 Tax=Palaemon carinicauda TaxID=392227 RepID=UPI0035B6556C
MEELRFDGRVVIVTGAGGGLGRAYALLFGSRGAKVVVNDLGGDRSGKGSSPAADKVVEEIKNAGGVAVANYDSVEDGDKVVQTALDNFGRVDIVVNNAGILRDRSFARTSDTDWDLVHRVHLRGSFLVTRAAFPIMKKQNFGRIIMTASTSGIYGNFGQSNYSAAKLGLLGLSNTVAIEGQKYNIHCNTLAPTGGTRLTEDILPPDLFEQLQPGLVAPLVLWLCHEDCNETGGLFEGAGGWFAKYRWERARGKFCRTSVHESVTPEAVRDNWDAITDFTDSDHPSSNREATAILASGLQDLSTEPAIKSNPTSASGSMEVTGPLSARGITLPPSSFTYEPDQLILYALGVGVSRKDEDALKFLYENDENFSALPTFAVIPSQAVMFGGKLWQQMNGYTPNLAKLLHGEMYIEIVEPLPTSGTLHTGLEVADVLDKGSGSVLILDSKTKDDSGNLVAKCQWSLFIVGDGNFGGPRTSNAAVPPIDAPKRTPDVTEEFQTNIDQPALYRLSGDKNPLHLDPSFAAIGGFSEPILHGLCTYGIAGRIILKAFCGNDVKKFKAMKARFAKPVIPGQTLVIDMWKEQSRIFYTCSVKETGQKCLTGGYVDIAESPAASEKLSPALTLGSAAVFQELSRKLAQDPSVVKKVNAIFLWNINVNGKLAGQWSVDLKNGSGNVYEGEPTGNEKPNVKITIEDEDMVALMSGKLNAQKAFLSGKLKASGNVMLMQKLGTLMTPQSKM